MSYPDLPRLLEALRLVQESQEARYQWTLLHMHNVRLVLAAIVRLRRRLSGVPPGDCEAVLAPLVMPHLPSLLLGSVSDNTVAVGYLEDCGAAHVPTTLRLAILDALEASLRQPTYRATWERARKIFSQLA